jgi:ribosomal protein S18 acetylase RimI-like enzyme
MEFIIGNETQLEACACCLSNCVLGERYFYDKKHTVEFLKDGFEKGEIYLCVNNDTILGFMRIDPQGTFSKFPLLRVIAVNEKHRNQGIGKAMIEFYELMGFEESNKVFLLVSEFNTDAKRLYERLGYTEVGKIPDLYQKDIAEYFMMKKKEERG